MPKTSPAARTLAFVVAFLVLRGFYLLAYGEEVVNFALLDQHGRFHELRRSGAQAIVLFFTSSECEWVRKNAWKLKALQKSYAERGVLFWLVDSDSRDDRARLLRESEELRIEPLPILKDDTQGVARLLGVRRSCETVAISASDWRVFYRGALDGQLVESPNHSTFLKEALDQFLADKQISTPRTETKGCDIEFQVEKRSVRSVSYSTEIVPILARKCVVCHRPGDVGSWVMANYRKVHSMSAMIQEVILARRMPPWGADPEFGKFANDLSLNPVEAQTLLLWIEQGAPPGEGDDPLPPLAKPAEDWPLGPPDYVIRLGPERIPATGVLDLRHQFRSAPFTNEVWIGALDIKPSNRKVLHHVTLRTIYPGQKFADSVGIAGWNPGYRSTRYPEGAGRKFPKDVMFHVDLHYNTIGSEQTDQTEIGFYALPGPPKIAIEAGAVFDMDLSIPPGEPNLKMTALKGFDRATLIYDLRPHMHYRGSWFKYELLLPDGHRETLLSVPRYDFNWQTTYTFAEPMRVPAGAWLLCTGGFDNSTQNPANPDPSKRIQWGEQSWDEMFIGHFNASTLPPKTD